MPIPCSLWALLLGSAAAIMGKEHCGRRDCPTREQEPSQGHGVPGHEGSPSLLWANWCNRSQSGTGGPSPSEAPTTSPFVPLGEGEEGSGQTRKSPSFPGAPPDTSLGSRLCSRRFVGYPGNYRSFLGVRNEEVSAGQETHGACQPSWGRCVLQGRLPVLRVLPSLCAGPGGLRAPLSPQCSPGGCFIELAQELLVIMVGKQIINNVQEVAIP